MFKIFLILTFSFSIFANTYQGVIVKKQGEAELLINPSKTFKKGLNDILYEGMYYKIQTVRLGLKVYNGNIIRTKKGSKLRVVYRNGDQVNIGEASTLQVYWERKQKKKRDGAHACGTPTTRGTFMLIQV